MEYLIGAIISLIVQFIKRFIIPRYGNLGVIAFVVFFSIISGIVYTIFTTTNQEIIDNVLKILTTSGAIYVFFIRQLEDKLNI